jgi:hypothetical protein
MSRALFHPRAILSATALTVALLGTACSDSTAPTTGQGSGGGSPKAQLPGGPTAAPGDAAAAPKDTAASGDTTAATAARKPAFLIQETWWAQRPYLRPGNVRIPLQQSTACVSNDLLGRNIAVSGMQVGALGIQMAPSIPQIVRVLVSFYRWNPTSQSWQLWTKRYWDSPDQSNAWVSNYTSVPTISFSPDRSGYYSVKVRVEWWFPQSLEAYRMFAMTSSTDYTTFGNSWVGNGFCYIS